MQTNPRNNAKKLRLEALENRELLSADSLALAADFAAFEQNADDANVPALVSNAQIDGDDDAPVDLTDVDANNAAAPKFAVVSAGNPSRTSVSSTDWLSLLNASFKNVGNASAKGYTVDVYASTDKTLSFDDVLLTTYSNKYAVVGTGSARWALPSISFTADGLDAGKYYIVWTISSGQGETATTATAVCAKTLTVEGNANGEVATPDLKAFDGGWATKYSVVQGESFDFTTGWVANVGEGSANAGFKATLYASTDKTITADDAPLATLESTKALNRFAGTTFRFNDVSTAGLDAGEYYLGWIVSDVDGESETATENNVGRSCVKLTVDANEPDLKAFDGGFLSTRRLNVGETFDLKTGCVSNVGKGVADAGYKVAVFASLDRTLSDDDVPLGTLDATTALNRFGATTFSFDDLATDVLEAGRSYYIGWAITDVAREANETNNAAFCPIKLTLNGELEEPAENASNLAAVGLAYCDNYKSVVRGLQVLCKSGFADAGYELAVYATKKSTFSPETSVVIAETDDTQALRTGQSASYSLDISTSSLKKGTYKLFWTITDADGETILGRFMNDLIVRY